MYMYMYDEEKDIVVWFVMYNMMMNVKAESWLAIGVCLSFELVPVFTA